MMQECNNISWSDTPIKSFDPLFSPFQDLKLPALDKPTALLNSSLDVSRSVLKLRRTSTYLMSRNQSKLFNLRFFCIFKSCWFICKNVNVPWQYTCIAHLFTSLFIFCPQIVIKPYTIFSTCILLRLYWALELVKQYVVIVKMTCFCGDISHKYLCWSFYSLHGQNRGLKIKSCSESNVVTFFWCDVFFRTQ